MGFEQAYTDKNTLLKSIQEDKFNRLVRELVIQRKITRPEAERIARQILTQRRLNYLALQEYYDRLVEKEIVEAKKRKLMALNRKRVFDTKVNEIMRMQKERELLDIKRRMRLQENYRQQLIKESQKSLPLRKDVIATELNRFKGMILRFIEPVKKYGIVKAQIITGKSINMLRTQRNTMINMLTSWFIKNRQFMTQSQINEYNNLINQLQSLNMEVR